MYQFLFIIGYVSSIMMVSVNGQCGCLPGPGCPNTYPCYYKCQCAHDEPQNQIGDIKFNNNKDDTVKMTPNALFMIATPIIIVISLILSIYNIYYFCKQKNNKNNNNENKSCQGEKIEYTTDEESGAIKA